jgi:hypothetical protein
VQVTLPPGVERAAAARGQQVQDYFGKQPEVLA